MKFYPLFGVIFSFLLHHSSLAIGGDSGAYSLSEQYDVGDAYMGIRLRGAVQIPASKKSGFSLVELSDLAWDSNQSILYAINDQGVLFHLKPYFIDLSLFKIEIIKAYPLLDAKGKRLKSSFRDAEGLSIYRDNNGKQNLAISFERTPRIDLYSPTGQYQRTLPLTLKLQQVQKYRSRNKMLEALIWHPRRGLLTGSERPFRGQTQHQVFDSQGNRWRFQPHKAPNSAMVALEMWPNSHTDLLVLERAYVAPWQPLIISLRRLRYCPPNQADNCPVETIAEFDSSQDWRLDNFEGLTHHQGRYFFMVSDDNNSLLQQTILVYFELL